MVTSVTSNPGYYSYLGNVLGVQNPAPAQPPSSSGNTTSSSNAAAAVSALLGNNSSGFTPEILSLLQSNSAGSFNPVASLLGGPSTNNALTGLLSNLYATSASASITQAKNNVSPNTGSSSSSSAPTGSALIQSLIHFHA